MPIKDQNQIGFAPNDPTDGREKGDWKSRYSSEARKKIYSEAIYLALIFLSIPVLLFFLVTDFNFNIDNLLVVKKYFYAWLGGTLGGVLFAIKWLYHSVARNIWNEDRTLWRLFTPHISGALAVVILALLFSNTFKIPESKSIIEPCKIFGISFLVGYFSDTAFGKLSDLAKTLFGATEKHKNSK